MDCEDDDTEMVSHTRSRGSSTKNSIRRFVYILFQHKTKLVTIKNKTQSEKKFSILSLSRFSFHIFSATRIFTWNIQFISCAYTVSDFCCIAQLNFHKLYTGNAKTVIHTQTNNMQDAAVEIAQWGIF